MLSHYIAVFDSSQPLRFPSPTHPLHLPLSLPFPHTPTTSEMKREYAQTWRYIELSYFRLRY